MRFTLKVWRQEDAEAEPGRDPPRQQREQAGARVPVDRAVAVREAQPVRRQASNSSCKRCHTPARFHSARRRQQVIPDPKPNSCGRNSHWRPVCSTNKIPHSTCRSGTGLRTGYRNLRSRFGSG